MSEDIGAEIRRKLYESADEKYRTFSLSLLPGVNKLIGVRLPVLRKMAAQIIKSGYWREYLNSSTDGIFEENMLHGMVTGGVNTDFDSKVRLIEEFIPLIDNWSVCDSFCASGVRQLLRLA